jgi:hypothetical protein
VESRKLLVDENEAAAMLGVSVSFMRKDRRTKRLIPFVKLGVRVLYSPERVQRALHALEEGGQRSGKPHKLASAVADVALP